ncbi:MAG: 2-isopropylmalate synthase [Gemmatimonadetes bacterium]|nr:2-isopropylmalate synthase [Gemmatimonadota bacterium]
MQEDLIYDWNHEGGFTFRAKPGFHLNDETLRDGLQSPSVRDPSIEEKLEILHLMAELGLNAADLGLPGAGERAVSDITRLAREIAEQKLAIAPNVACRTVIQDLEPVADIAQAAGIPVEACTFLGSSAIRQYTEGWELDRLVRLTDEAVRFAVAHDIPVCYVTEDTTRAQPDTLERLYTTAIEAGAKRIVIADTVGHATPIGVRALLKHIMRVVKKSGADVKIDWHGHSDRGLALPNCMMALATGADRIHATALGVGERCGNAQMDLLLVNLRLEGLIDRDLSRLGDYVRKVSEATRVPIPFSYPVFGEDAFRTSTGVHAAAILKARRKGESDLADAVYSGVPAAMVGLGQKVEIGFMSGKSNVVFALEARGITPDDELVDRILAVAKRSETVLTESEIESIVQEHRRAHGQV